MSSERELTVGGDKALSVAEALNATTIRILQILATEKLDVTTISKRLDLSEAYISEQIKQLEALQLVKISYERGKRGIRKICESVVDRVTLVIVDKPVVVAEKSEP